MGKDKRILAFCGGELLLEQEADGKWGLPCRGIVDEPAAENIFDLGEAVAFEVSDSAPTEGLTKVELRKSYGLLSEKDYALAAKGKELVHWDGTMRYCPRCASELKRSGEISKTCAACGAEYFPQLSPAVLVLVRRGGEALLVHSRNFRRNFFGLVAGFVEMGESMEDCVRREVMEETSLRICNVRYFGSQTWPFPAQLMVGFTADYASGELRFADGELTDGGFFTPENLPELPTPPSLARTMIDAWLRDTRK